MVLVDFLQKINTLLSSHPGVFLQHVVFGFTYKVLKLINLSDANCGVSLLLPLNMRLLLPSTVTGPAVYVRSFLAAEIETANDWLIVTTFAVEG